MAPSVSGAVVGLAAGAAALGLVHALVPGPLGAVVGARHPDLVTAFAVAYGTAAALGGVLGAAFGVVTRYLRKWVPLVMWGMIFFTSLALLVLAVGSSYGHTVAPVLSGPILLASAAFGFVLSFSLPIRRRR